MKTILNLSISIPTNGTKSFNFFNFLMITVLSNHSTTNIFFCTNKLKKNVDKSSNDILYYLVNLLGPPLFILPNLEMKFSPHQSLLAVMPHNFASQMALLPEQFPFRKTNLIVLHQDSPFQTAFL